MATAAIDKFLHIASYDVKPERNTPSTALFHITYYMRYETKFRNLLLNPKKKRKNNLGVAGSLYTFLLAKKKNKQLN